MRSFDRRSTFIIKVISAAIITSFFAQEIVWAAPLALPSAAVAMPSVSFKVPASAGIVDDFYDAFRAPRAREAGTSGKLIVLIQDAHTNPSAQFNAARVLDEVLAREGMKLVFTEADHGNVSLDYLKKYFAPAALRAVSESFVRKGALKGTEYLSATSDHPFTLLGVESPVLYDESLRAYAEVAGGRDRALAYADRLRRSLHALQKGIFSAELVRMDGQRALRSSGALSLADYSDLLWREAGRLGIYRGSYRGLTTLSRLSRIEKKIDLKRASKEAGEALRALNAPARERLSAAAGHAAETAVMKRGENASAGYYAALEEELRKTFRAWEVLHKYPALGSYFRYLKHARRFEALRAVEELDRLEAEVFDRLARTPQEKHLLEFSRNAEDLEAALRFELSPERFHRFEERQSRFDTRIIGGYVNYRILQDSKNHDSAVFLNDAYEKTLAEAVRFYRLAAKRDRIFVDRMVRAMEEGGQSRAALFVGGFHAPNIKHLLRDRGISFVSVLPQVTHETDHARYEKILLSQTVHGRKSRLAAAREEIRTARAPKSGYAAQPQGVIDGARLAFFEALTRSGADAPSAQALLDEGRAQDAAGSVPLATGSRMAASELPDGYRMGDGLPNEPQKEILSKSVRQYVEDGMKERRIRRTEFHLLRFAEALEKRSIITIRDLGASAGLEEFFKEQAVPGSEQITRNMVSDLAGHLSQDGILWGRLQEVDLMLLNIDHPRILNMTVEEFFKDLQDPEYGMRVKKAIRSWSGKRERAAEGPEVADLLALSPLALLRERNFGLGSLSAAMAYANEKFRSAGVPVRWGAGLSFTDRPSAARMALADAFKRVSLSGAWNLYEVDQADSRVRVGERHYQIGSFSDIAFDLYVDELRQTVRTFSDERMTQFPYGALLQTLGQVASRTGLLLEWQPDDESSSAAFLKGSTSAYRRSPGSAYRWESPLDTPEIAGTRYLAGEQKLFQLEYSAERGPYRVLLTENRASWVGSTDPSGLPRNSYWIAPDRTVLVAGTGLIAGQVGLGAQHFARIAAANRSPQNLVALARAGADLFLLRPEHSGNFSAAPDMILSGTLDDVLERRVSAGHDGLVVRFDAVVEGFDGEIGDLSVSEAMRREILGRFSAAGVPVLYQGGSDAQTMNGIMNPFALELLGVPFAAAHDHQTENKCFSCNGTTTVSLLASLGASMDEISSIEVADVLFRRRSTDYPAVKAVTAKDAAVKHHHTDEDILDYLETLRTALPDGIKDQVSFKFASVDGKPALRTLQTTEANNLYHKVVVNLRVLKNDGSYMTAAEYRRLAQKAPNLAVADIPGFVTVEERDGVQTAVDLDQKAVNGLTDFIITRLRVMEPSITPIVAQDLPDGKGFAVGALTFQRSNVVPANLALLMLQMGLVPGTYEGVLEANRRPMSILGMDRLKYEIESRYGTRPSAARMAGPDPAEGGRLAGTRVTSPYELMPGDIISKYNVGLFGDPEGDAAAKLLSTREVPYFDHMIVVGIAQGVRIVRNNDVAVRVSLVDRDGSPVTDLQPLIPLTQLTVKKPLMTRPDASLSGGSRVHFPIKGFESQLRAIADARQISREELLPVSDGMRVLGVIRLGADRYTLSGSGRDGWVSLQRAGEDVQASATLQDVSDIIDQAPLSPEQLLALESGVLDLIAARVNAEGNTLKPVNFEIDATRMLSVIQDEDIRFKAMIRLERLVERASRRFNWGAVQFVGSEDLKRFQLKSQPVIPDAPTIRLHDISDLSADLPDGASLLPYQMKDGQMIPVLSSLYAGYLIANLRAAGSVEEAATIRAEAGPIIAMLALMGAEEPMTEDDWALFGQYDPQAQERYLTLSVKGRSLRGYLDLLIYMQQAARMAVSTSA